MFPAESALRPAHRATLTVAMLVLACACETESIGAPSPGSGATVALSSAGAPSMEVTPINEVFDLPCGTFTIHASYTGWMRTTTFFDRSGTPVKLQIQISVQGTATNLQTGKTVKDDEHPVVVIDFRTGTETVNGAPAHVTAPGEGIIIHDTGRITFDAEGHVTFEAGPHDQADQGPLEAYCSALS